MTPLTIFPQIHANYVEDDVWTSHDLTFQSTTDSPFQWTAGTFFYFQHYNQPYSVYDKNQPQLSAPAGAAPNPQDYFLYLDYQFNVESIAGYGQASYKFNDQFKISGNMRYNWDDKWGTESSRYIVFSSTTMELPAGASLPSLPAALLGLPAYSVFGANMPALDITGQICTSTGQTNVTTPSCLTGPLAFGVKSAAVITPAGFAERQLGVESRALTGGAEIEWTPTEDIFTYARYGRGYESPSFNAGQTIAQPAVHSEYLNAYEVGYKQSFGKGLLVDMAVYYYDYEGLQVPLAVSNGGVTQALFVGIPKSVSEGFEAEVYWSPITDLLVTASYSYDHTAILTGCNGTWSRDDRRAGPLLAANSLCVRRHQRPGGGRAGGQALPGPDHVPSFEQRLANREGQSAA